MPLATIAMAFHLATAGSPHPLFSIPAAELRLAFDGVLARSELTFGNPESFGKDGGYSRQSRVMVTGRFWIENDAVCIVTTLQPTASCRSFGRSADGLIFLTALRTSDAVHVLSPPIPFALTVLNAGDAGPEGT